MLYCLSSQLFIEKYNNNIPDLIWHYCVLTSVTPTKPKQTNQTRINPNNLLLFKIDKHWRIFFSDTDSQMLLKVAAYM